MHSVVANAMQHRNPASLKQVHYRAAGRPRVAFCSRLISQAVRVVGVATMVVLTLGTLFHASAKW